MAARPPRITPTRRGDPGAFAVAGEDPVLAPTSARSRMMTAEEDERADAVLMADAHHPDTGTTNPLSSVRSTRSGSTSKELKHMRSLPWSLDGTWHRANLHAHTHRSDGMASPTEVAGLYARHGYDVVALTDHFLERYGWPLTGPEHVEGRPLTVLRGAELHTGTTRAGHLWHMLAVGLPKEFAPPAADERIGDLVARAVAAGAFVAVPHPSWSMLSDADMADVSPFHAVEIWNATADDHNGRPDGTHSWRSLLETDRSVGAIAADDTHLRPERADAVCAWTMIRATGPDDLVRALRAGAYYASTGPILHDVRVVAGEVVVDCSPSRRAWLCGTGFTSVARRGVGTIEWHLPIERLGSSWATVTVEDAWGRRAWTNAFDVADRGPEQR